MAKRTGTRNFASLLRKDVPRGRNGKHRVIVQKILSDLDQLRPGSAMRVPLSELRATKAKLRSALNRAAHKAGRIVATASDDQFLYVWNDRPHE